MGTFQIKSRAQVSITAFKPRTCRDLVVSVAIVTPKSIRADLVLPTCFPAKRWSRIQARAGRSARA